MRDNEAKIENLLKVCKSTNLQGNTKNRLDKIENQLKLLELNSSATNLENRENYLLSQSFQKIGSKFYYIEKREKLNWFGALNKCTRFNGHLASFQNKREFTDLLPHLNKNIWYWLDINDLGVTGTQISMTSGRTPAYVFWSNGEPNNSENKEHCTHLWTYNTGNWEMNDIECTQFHRFICEAS